VLAERIQRLIELYPTFGYRRLWAMLRFVGGIRVNRKAVYRLLMLKGCFVHQRSLTPRTRVHGLRSRAQRSDKRWALLSQPQRGMHVAAELRQLHRSSRCHH
jgi:putative transposase